MATSPPAKRHDPFLIPFAAHPQDGVRLINVHAIEAGEFAHAQTRGVQKFQKRAIAPQ